MPTGLERKLEKIRRLLDALVAESVRETPIVVEGENDREALRRLGVDGDIILAKDSGKSFQDALSEVEKRGKSEVILLLDFDRRGREWTKRLAQSLEGMRITPNMVFWKELMGLVGRDLKDIEGLASYVRTLQRKLGKNILGDEE